MALELDNRSTEGAQLLSLPPYKIKPMTEIKLGICKLPKLIYLYVSSGEEAGNTYCWYYRNMDTNINTPEYSDGLCGYLSDLRVTPKEYEGEDVTKLDIVISAGETYVIRSGIETNFSKSFLQAIALVEDLSKPLIIGCYAGKRNTVFCSIYDAATKSKVKAEWNASADWARIIANTQAKLEKRETPLPIAPRSKINRDSLIQESDRLIKDLGWDDAKGKDYLQQNYGKQGRSLLTDAELLDFVGKLQQMEIYA
jgi:hypothetical protein